MSTSARRSMHINSLAAYHEGREELFSKRELAILSAVKAAFAGSATDRTIMTVLRFTDMNSVRPRITELIKDGVLVEVGSEVDPITNKTVRRVAFRSRVASGQTELALAGGAS